MTLGGKTRLYREESSELGMGGGGESQAASGFRVLQRSPTRPTGLVYGAATAEDDGVGDSSRRGWELKKMCPWVSM